LSGEFRGGGEVTLRVKIFRLGLETRETNGKKSSVNAEREGKGRLGRNKSSALIPV